MIATVLLALTLMGTASDTNKPGQDTFALSDGDVIVFYGDSVTLERTDNVFRPKYPSFVESFVRARYPSLELAFHNRSRNVQTAAEASQRLDKDVLSLQPDIAVLCFGMTEARRPVKDQTGPEAYARHIEAMARKLKEAGCRVWLLSPPSVDTQRFAALKKANTDGRLKEYAEALHVVASRVKVNFVNWYSVSEKVLEEHRQRSARFRLTDDGVTPSPMGNSVAAVEILRAWNVRRYDYTIVLDFKNRSVRCPVGKATVKEGSSAGELEVYFEALPMFWPLSAGRLVQVDSTWPVNEMNRLLLKVENAPETGMLMRQGRREVPVLPFQLAEGINLAATPGVRDVQPVVDLLRWILEKNNVRAQAWSARQTRQPTEPELQKGFDKFLDALDDYVTGHLQIIKRIPRTFDATLVLKDIMAEAPDKKFLSGQPTPPKAKSSASQKDQAGKNKPAGK